MAGQRRQQAPEKPPDARSRTEPHSWIVAGGPDTDGDYAIDYVRTKNVADYSRISFRASPEFEN